MGQVCLNGNLTSMLISKIKWRLIWWLFKIKNTLGLKYSSVRLIGGGVLTVPNCDPMSAKIACGESYEIEARKKIFPMIKRGMTIIDIGAHIGYYTIPFSLKVGENGIVVAFEPNSDIRAQLQNNLDQNNPRNVIVVPYAVSNKNSVTDFYVAQKNRGGYSSLKKNKDYEPAKKIRVETKKLDDVLDSLGISEVDVIKIDVEGAEKLVFEGAKRLLTRKRKPIILFECNDATCLPFGHNVFGVLKLLDSFGYDLEEIFFGEWIAIPKTKWGNF